MDFEFFFDPDQPDCPYLKEVEDDILSIVTENIRKAVKGNDRVNISVAHALRDGIVKTPWAAYFMGLAKRFLLALGIPSENQRFFEKLPDERAHYSAQTLDLEVRLDRWGWVEVAGFAYRTDYDLKSHMIASGTDMRVFRPYQKPIEKTTTVVKPNYQRLRAIFGNEAGRVGGLLASADPKKMADSPGPVELDGFVVPRDCFNLNQVTVKEAGTKFLPHVIEPSFGVDRLLHATLAYSPHITEHPIIPSTPPNPAPPPPPPPPPPP